MHKPETATDRKPGVIEFGLVAFTLLVLSALSFDTVHPLPGDAARIVHWLDNLACAVFFIDFCARLYRAESKRAFMKWGWIDLIACIPYAPGLRYARLVRVLRVIRLLRGIRIVQRVFQLLRQNPTEAGAVSLIVTAVLLVVFSSISILVCEQAGQGSIKSAEDAIWWSVSTLTTVGYGDMVPVTTEGRILAMALMVAGVGMFGGLSGLVASLFLGGERRREAELAQVTAQLEAMRRQLDLLVREKEADRANSTAAGDIERR